MKLYETIPTHTKEFRTFRDTMCENKLALKENYFSTMNFLYEKANALTDINIENESDILTICKNTNTFYSPNKTKIGDYINSNVILYSTLSHSPDMSEIILRSFRKSISSNINESTSVMSPMICNNV